MNKSIDKERGKRILRVLLAWLLTALLLVIAASALIARMKLGKDSIPFAAAGIILISSAVASLFLYRGLKNGKRLPPALLLWVVIASTLFMLGFIMNSEGMDAGGLLRVLISSLVGCLFGLLLPGKQKRHPRNNKFMTAK